MKHFKNLLVAALTMFVATILAIPAFAATTGTITINNTPNGETYAVYKILDATVDSNGNINYLEPIPVTPTDLTQVLEVQTGGTAPYTYTTIGKKSSVSDADFEAALKDFVVAKAGAADWDSLIEDGTFANATDKKTASATSTTFDVDAGYYVICSTQGTAVMIDSATNPAAVINEKNSTTVTVDKEVDKHSYSVGDEVGFTGTFQTANFLPNDDNPSVVRPVIVYTISDTLPPYLSNVEIDEVTVGGDAITPTPQFTDGSTAYPSLDQTKCFDIEWATWNDTDKVWESKYNNGAEIVVKYHATLTDVTNIGQDDTNTITIKPKLGKPDGSPEPSERHWDDSDYIKTYAAALKKIDGQTKEAITTAEFQIKGLQATQKDPGVWAVTSYNPSSTATPTTLTTDSDGYLYIVGLEDNASLELTETKAPDGYNKLNGTLTLTPQLVAASYYKTTSWELLDPDGNVIASSSTQTSGYTEEVHSLADLNPNALVIENNPGTELPTTGGMGTTILYIVGGIMLVAGAVMFFTKRRVANMER